MYDEIVAWEPGVVVRGRSGGCVASVGVPLFALRERGALDG